MSFVVLKTPRILTASSPISASACKVDAPIWWLPITQGCFDNGDDQSAVPAEGSPFHASAAY